MDYLKEYKPHLLGAEGDARAFFENLEDWLITIETYQRAGVDPWMVCEKVETAVIRAGPGAPSPSKVGQLSTLELDPEGFKVVMDSHNFTSMLEELNKKIPLTND